MLLQLPTKASTTIFLAFEIHAISLIRVLGIDGLWISGYHSLELKSHHISPPAVPYQRSCETGSVFDSWAVDQTNSGTNFPSKRFPDCYILHLVLKLALCIKSASHTVTDSILQTLSGSGRTKKAQMVATGLNRRYDTPSTFSFCVGLQLSLTHSNKSEKGQSNLLANFIAGISTQLGIVRHW